MIKCSNLVKIYKTDEVEVVALQGLDLKVKKGEMMAIIGNSGCGKSTLLNMLGGLDRPSAGSMLIDDKELFKYTEKQLNIYMQETVGFVWQNNARNLIPYLSAKDNIMMPMTEKSRKNRGLWADELLKLVGLFDRKDHSLVQLSGGQQQRVAIAIALANRPKILLADEPTGSLDSKTTDMVLDIFRKFNKEYGITIVIVTHDLELSKKVDRVVSLRDGKVSSEFIHKRFYKKELEELDSSDLADDEDSHIEMVVVDKSGRLQLPAEYVDELKDREIDKLIVKREGDKIILSVLGSN